MAIANRPISKKKSLAMKCSVVLKLCKAFSLVVAVLACLHDLSGVRSDSTSKLFCLQGSWSNTNLYSGGNGSSSTDAAVSSANRTSTSDDMCQLVDLENTLAFPKPRINPIVNPVCTYPDDYETYKRLLKGPCYDYACYAQGKKCVKWTMYSGPVLLNVSRLCAVAKEVGCFTQVKGSVTTEVCICDDQHFCNAAQTMMLTTPIFTTIVMVTLIFFIYLSILSF